MNPVLTMSTLLGAAALSALASTAQGAVLADYQFGGNPATSSDVDANSTASAFAPTGTNAAISTSSGTAFVRSIGTGTDAAAAAADDDFFTFTVTGDGGQVLNLSSLTLSLGASNNTGAGGPAAFANTLYVTSGAALIGTAGSTVNNTNGAPSLPASPSFDLSAPEYQGLTSITFRLAFSDDANNEASINRLDNVVLNGTTALVVPEPGMLALAPLTLATMMRRRR